MGAEEQAVASLASSVADGTPIDWESAESGLDGRGRRLARHLRLVESIATLHRTLPSLEVVEHPGVPGRDGEQWGRLILLDRIGEGTSCHVYRAWDTELHRDVAVKLFHDDGGSHDRVLEEARRLARVSHPHVVHVYGAEEHSGRAGLWMELVRGESLEEIVKSRGHLGAHEALLVGFDLCAALAAVHGAGLLHRDLKAQNVMREAGGRIVLMDFGTGEELQRQAGTARLVGTPLYLAPEIFRGEPATVRTDIYGLGVVLFYVVTGEFPVIAPTMHDLARAHVEGQSRRLRDLRPDLPEPFVRVVERALSPDPARRYATAGEMEAALREALHDEPPASAVARPDAARLTAGARRRLFMAATAAAALLAVMAALILWNRNRAAAPTMSRIAVLPIADLSEPSSPPYFAEALTDQLISTLGQIEALRITPRASVIQLTNQGLPPSEVANRLKVDGFIESTVVVTSDPARGADVVQVNARLLTAGTGTQVWSGTFDGVLGDTFGLQSQLAQQIAEAVRAKISDAEKGRLQRTKQSSAAAERAYFEGVHHLTRADGARQAFDAFGRAIALDPSFAAAHAGLARSYLALGSAAGTISQPEARARALGAADRAVSLDPDSSEAQAALADLKFAYDWDWTAAEAAYRRAIELNASYTSARTQYARFLASRGRLDDAVAEATRSVERDPTSVDAAQVLGLVKYYHRDYTGALAALDSALRLDRSRPGTYLLMARVHAARGATDAAIDDNRRAIQLATGPVPGWNAHLLMLEASAGRHAEVRGALAGFRASMTQPGSRLAPQHLAYIHAALGDEADAIDLLDRAVDLRDPDVVFLAVDPRVDPLRDHPRFEALLARIGITKALDRR